MTAKKKKTAKPVAVKLSNNFQRLVRAGFDAAQTTKDNARHWSMADACSADAEARHDVRHTLRIRSRYEILNNSYARGVVNMLANDTIGTGPRLQFLSDDEELNEKIEKDFACWSSEIHLAQLLRLMRMARCQDGETFAVIGTNPKLKNPVKIKIDVIEADRIQSEDFTDEFGDLTVDGIKYDAYGNAVSYQMLKYHPGDDRRCNSLEYLTIPAEYMIHSFIKYRPGLHRGVPELTAALPLFAQLRRYNLATLAAAESAADFAAILYTDAPPDGETDAIEPLDSIPLERNMMLTVPAGWKMGQLEAKHPTANHSEFVKCILSELARCISATYGTVAGDFSGFNYASGRLDNQIYQRSILVDRSLWESEVLNPLFEAWLREWSLVNHVSIQNDILHEWFWDGFLHVDPTKEANAQQTKLENLLTTLTDEYAKQGMDFYKKMKVKAREMKLLRELGIVSEQNEQSSGNQNRKTKQEEDKDDEE